MSKYKNNFFVFLMLTFMIIGVGCNRDNSNSILPTSAPTILFTPTPMISITPTPMISILPTPTISPVINDKSLNSTITLLPEDLLDEKLDDYLCGENEEVLLSFNIANSNKTASICISKSQPDYIVYRFGTKDYLELEYHDMKDADSWARFTYSYYLRGGGAGNEGLDLNYLIFDNGEYEYQIYDEYSAEDDKTRVGITVTSLETGDETDIEGKSDSIQGGLVTLRDNEKINIEIQ